MPRSPEQSQAVRILAGSGAASDPNWRQALTDALDSALEPLAGEPPDLLLLFVSDVFSDDYEQILREAADRSEAPELAGCSGHGVIGSDRELEAQPAIAALALCFPSGSFVSLRHVVQDEVVALRGAPSGAATVDGPSWPRLLGLLPNACTGLIVLADPFSLNVEPLIAGLSRDFPGVPIVGGLASGHPGVRHTHVFSGTRPHAGGAVVVGLSGNVALRAVVSQGCEPIGEPWTVTDARGHIIRSIGNRSAYQVLVEILEGLSEQERRRVARNLLVGLAMDEYRDEFKRGDFLIRNLMGVDQKSGAIAVGAHPRIGQTLQFQVRDARAADEDLRHLLAQAEAEMGEPPGAALLFACNGRGAGLFGEPHHDARAARELLGSPPLAGLFCNGEIGPVGGGTFLHGFTASLGLIVSKGR